MAVRALNIWNDTEERTGYSSIIEFPRQEKKSITKRKVVSLKYIRSSWKI